jgi:PPP family 3-phenylpropionic acid transporter
LSLAAIVPFAFADSYTGLLLSSIAFGLVYPPIHPILDNLTVGHAAAQGFGFGRLRRGGSMAFLAINVGTGFLLQRTAAGTSLVLWLVAGGLLSTAFTAHALPELPRPPAHRDGKAITALLAQGRFLLFLVTVGCLQGSHGGYYTFATLHWLASGISKEVAGLLWAEGVLAEIFTFATMALFVRRFRPSTLLLFSALAGAIRWTVLAETVSLPLLFAVNWLHAASFALAYLGAVQHIARVIPGRQGATAQGLMGAATSGVFTCLCTRLAGPLYERAQGGMFLAMAAVAACGGVLALLLRRVEGRS